ncbi:uncharacterized protein N7496_012503 [Penicillium cataractarum]|uniref:Uncharacterized protein n=1 Tax=Penicillium cataractarum TaxID=2100454 RepID=A0A9W9R7Z3_9EURO|nr:uncharacterized protein N7496_012503 [Penicillium cataractarum]KAJ5355291.1 hypothetical protein N7496_012503 [Penicillium cataractarum]
MRGILNANNITSFDTSFKRLIFYMALANDHMLCLLARRYAHRNPTAASIMGQIARLELQERQNQRAQGSHPIPSRPTSSASAPSTPSTHQTPPAGRVRTRTTINVNSTWELAYYYAFATPEDVKVAMINVLLQNNITNLHGIFSILRRHSPSGPSILTDITELELEDRENRRLEASGTILKRPVSPIPTPYDIQDNQVNSLAVYHKPYLFP